MFHLIKEGTGCHDERNVFPFLSFLSTYRLKISRSDISDDVKLRDYRATLIAAKADTDRLMISTEREREGISPLSPACTIRDRAETRG